MSASVKRIKCQSEVGGQGAVEHDGGQWVPPQSQKPNTAGFHCFERDQAQGVIDEMGREVSQQHETRDQAYASNDHGSGLNLLRPGVYSPLSGVIDCADVIPSQSEESVSILARIIHGAQPPRSKPLRSRAMGLYLEEGCILKWCSVVGGRSASLWPSTRHVSGPLRSYARSLRCLLLGLQCVMFFLLR